MLDNYSDAKKEFYFYKKGTAGSFATSLFYLFEMANIVNKEKLGLGFPQVYLVLKDYMESKNEEEFFKDMK